MELDKKSVVSDAVGNLYRAAFFLARGKREEKEAINLINKTKEKIPSLSKKLNNLLEKYFYRSKSRKNRLILAEKILDEYLLLK